MVISSGRPRQAKSSNLTASAGHSRWFRLIDGAVYRSARCAFAVTMSDDIQALHVECERHTSSLQRDWEVFVKELARKANRPVPELLVLRSPYRFIISPSWIGSSSSKT